MKKQVLLSIGLMLCSLIGIGQNTPFSGQILNPISKTLSIEYVYDQFTGEDAFFQVDLKPDGTFVADLEIQGPTVVFLSHAGRQFPIFVENNQACDIKFQAKNPQESLFGSADFIQNNQLFQAYYKEFKTNKGGESYLFVGGLGAKVKDEDLLFYQSHKPDENFVYIQEKRKAALSFLEEKKAVNQEAKAAYNYIKTDINYYWNIHLLMFGQTNNPANLEAYKTALSFSNIKDAAVFYHPQFLQFLNIYALKNCANGKELNFYKDLQVIYGCIKRNDDLSPPIKEYIIGKLLFLNLRSESMEAVHPLFVDFIETVQSTKIKEALSQKYELANEFKTGVIAPDFELENQYGESVKLSDFKGKKVFISFWASWCRPCLRNMEYARKNKAKLANENIEFVYVSIDNYIEEWRKGAVVAEETGTHLWADRRIAAVLRLYKVAVLPKYFLIDEEGKFITGFPSVKDDAFVDFIRNQ